MKATKNGAVKVSLNDDMITKAIVNHLETQLETMLETILANMAGASPIKQSKRNVVKVSRQGKPIRNQRTGKLTQGFLAVQSASRSRNGIANIDDIMSRTLEDPVWKEKWNPKDPCLAVWQALYNEQKEGRIINEKRGVWRVTGKGFRWLETKAASF